MDNQKTGSQCTIWLKYKGVNMRFVKHPEHLVCALQPFSFCSQSLTAADA